MLACASGHAQLISLLIMHGASPSIQNSDGETAFMVACNNGHTECVLAFLQLTQNALNEEEVDVEAAPKPQRALGLPRAALLQGTQDWAEREVMLQLQRLLQLSATQDSSINPLDSFVEGRASNRGEYHGLWWSRAVRDRQRTSRSSQARQR